MNIGIDARELAGHATGVGRYVSNLCRLWSSARYASEHNIVLYTHKPIAKTIANPQSIGANISYTTLPGRGDAWWEQTRLAMAINRGPIDVFFGPAYSLPIGTTVPSVVTLHDLSFFRRPDWFRFREGLRRRTLTQQAVRVANKIIAVSEFSKQELVELLAVPQSRIQVIYNGITPFNLRTLDSPSDRHLILYVGSIFNRRHIPALISAFSQVRQVIHNSELVIVGSNRTYPRQDLDLLARHEGVQDCVTFLDYAAEASLSNLYRRASVFVFLSEYEGFGMTPLEAMTAGVPVIVGDTQVAHEIYRNAAYYVDVKHPVKIAQSIVKLLREPAVRKELLSNAKSSLSRFTWTTTARQTLATIESVAGQQV